MDQRKENVLNIATNVKNMDIITSDDPLITDYQIPFNIDAQSIIKLINEFGHFKAAPTPILETVTVDSSKGDVKIRWILDNVEAVKRNEVNRLKVEWSRCSAEYKHQDDDNVDDAKVEWNEKVIDVGDVWNTGNVVDIGKYEVGKYLVRAQCMINDKASMYSNIKSFSITERQAIFKWTNSTNDWANITENGTRVTTNVSGYWIAVTSSTGWNSGKWFWRIKLNKRSGGNDGLGVTSDYQASSNSGYLWATNPSVVCYRGDNSITKNGSYIKT